MNGNLIASTKGAAALCLGLLLACCQKPKRPLAAIDSGPLVQTLVGARQPEATIARVKQAALAGEACRYAEAAARAALDADLHALVQPLINAAPKSCPQKSTLLGEGAEALARAGEKDAAKEAAKQAMAPDPKNQYAELALARVSYDENQMNACSEHATKALVLGRGAEADRLLGRAFLALGKLQDAEAHYQNVLKANPNDAEAAFSAAVCNDKLGHYSAAREGFLQTLRIDPKHVEARKYLVLLTYHAGAKAEAQHHLEKLAELLPKDSAIIAELQALISTDPADAGAPKKP
jgi:tetratricopeptide (TPR) repeat protein